MSPDELHLRACIASWAAALYDKDLDRLMAHYTPDIMAFNMVPPLKYQGGECRQNMAGWMAHFDGPLSCEHHDLPITLSGDVAFSTSFNHVTGKHHDGETSDFRTRATIDYRKIDGE